MNHKLSQKILKTEQPMLQLIREGETETLEFIESFGEGVIETVCVFVNSHGGSGIDKMIDECQSAKMPEPIFESSAAGFRVSFNKGPEQQKRFSDIYHDLHGISNNNTSPQERAWRG